MVVADDWGFDPSVRMTRRVFGRIEMVQGVLINEELRHS
jgi:hypothetical protein